MTTPTSTDATDEPDSTTTATPWRRLGIALALVTALVSGVSVFVNGYGVRRFGDATVYTTAKNVVAGLVILGLTGVAGARRSASGWTPPRGRDERLGLVAVAVVGGSVPFVLFFEGLSRVASPDAAFIHKTLVVWVAILAATVLRERLTGWHLLAIGALLLGEAELRGGVGWPEAGSGELLLLAATLCWSVEVVVAKRLLRRLSPLTVSTARMAGGVALLLAWLVVSGRVDDLARLAAHQWGWALATGLLLTAYVVTWHHALAAAPAIDVSAVLVVGALVTAGLDAVVNGAALAPQVPGLVLVAVGAALILALARSRSRAHPPAWEPARP